MSLTLTDILKLLTTRGMLLSPLGIIGELDRNSRRMDEMRLKMSLI